MRELKFRAWDPDMKSLSPSTTMADWLEKYALVAEASGVPLEDLSGYSEKLVFQQYTGLEDKNGVEIYEGDIVTAFGTVGVVEYFTDLNWDSGGSLHPGFYCKAWCEYKSDGELSYNHGFDDCEILGNIYENPELLK